MTHVRLTEDGTTVAETIHHDPEGLYHPSLIWHPANTLADWQALLTGMATAQRWAHETGGITLPTGVRVRTGRDDQLMIGNAVASMPLLGVDTIRFKSDSGWVDLDLPALQAVAAAVARHVQTCFMTEAIHHQVIESLHDVAAARTYDVTTGWPA